MNKKVLILSVMILMMIGIAPYSAKAEDGGGTNTTTSSTVPPLPELSSATRDQLLAIIKNQRAELEAIRTRIAGNVPQCVEAKKKIEFLKKLRQGDNDNDVKDLQKILSTDKSVYPEGKVTGFFGPLTAQALIRFQTKSGLPATGTLDDATVALINKILTDQSVSTDIPKGLLIAPGLRDHMKMWMTNGHMMGADDHGASESNSGSDSNSNN